jgi:hypothetical protein
MSEQPAARCGRVPVSRRPQRTGSRPQGLLGQRCVRSTVELGDDVTQSIEPVIVLIYWDFAVPATAGGVPNVSIDLFFATKRSPGFIEQRIACD